MIKKKVYFVLGVLFFGIGIFGYYMPVVPGTIFMIIAAYFFMHSSDKFYNKIANHPVYGSPIKNYIERNHISVKAKFIILGSMWLATLATVYFLPSMAYLTAIGFIDYILLINIKYIGIALAGIGTIVVLRAKS
tara:strand:+ start:619 stop:1020 length:402 start_codon:yes stop_codon:yes gene_type:complete